MAGHLVLPVRRSITPLALRQQLQDAHRFLVAAARETVPQLTGLSAATWGTDAKRKPVRLPSSERPHLVSTTELHSFAEVVNQCATLERLLDALGWVETVGELDGASVVVCNPTTSSAPRTKDGTRESDDHDLVLEGRDGARFKFEVSDVAGQNDGNGKEKKDLISLGVLAKKEADDLVWPTARCFLVVSAEFAVRLRQPTRHGLQRGLFHYEELKNDGATRIFEVRQGAKPAPDRGGSQRSRD